MTIGARTIASASRCPADEPEDAGYRNDSGPISGGTNDYQTCSRRAGHGGVPGRAHRRVCQPRRSTEARRHRFPSASTTAPASAPTSPPATAAPVTTAPGGQASAPRYHTSQLSLAFTGFNEASGGQRGMTLILTNHSGTTCHVYGYPGLAFFDGLPMGTHLTWVKESHATVVLHPRGNAQAC